MSVYQPAPGQNSTTVAPGLTPQNLRLSTGWRQASRPFSAGDRQYPATAASIVPAAPWAAAGAGPGAPGRRPHAARPKVPDTPDRRARRERRETCDGKALVTRGFQSAFGPQQP